MIIVTKKVEGNWQGISQIQQSRDLLELTNFSFKIQISKEFFLHLSVKAFFGKALDPNILGMRSRRED